VGGNHECIDKDEEGNSEECTISQKSCCDNKEEKRVLWGVRLVALEGKKKWEVRRVSKDGDFEVVGMIWETGP